MFQVMQNKSESSEDFVIDYYYVINKPINEHLP